MTCQHCGKSLTGRQTKFCSKRCSGLAVGKLPQGHGGRMTDTEWRQSRARIAGLASAKSRRQVLMSRVDDLTPQAAYRRGYVTAREMLRRHYQAWAVRKVQSLLGHRNAS